MNVFYVVAGGPSLFGFDWKRLEDRNVIAVNRAFEALPQAQYVYFSDFRFWNWHKESLLAHKGKKVSGAKELNDPAIVKYRLTGTAGLDTAPGCLRSGNNSAYAAINLAIQLGAEVIYVLGLDMKFDDKGRTHWHSGHPLRNREQTFSKMIKYFDSLAEEVRKLGVRVYNCSRDSAVTCFHYLPIDSALIGEDPLAEREAA